MKPLAVLLLAFAISLAATKLFAGTFDYQLAGCIGMSAMLLFTMIGHFAFPKGMSMMLPDFIPFKKEMVIATGFIELAAAIGLLVPSMRYLTSVLLIVFFILVLPANINAAIRHIDYQKGTFEGSGIKYLWFRVPLQILFIIWVWYFGIHLE